MARNIEIKARVADLAALETTVAGLADEGPVVITQNDTFFRAETGRLKLRDFLTKPASGELIYYQRSDQTGPTASFYRRVLTDDPTALRDVLAAAQGINGRVEKTRRLYLVGRTRIHLDRVAGLGTFMELEVVLADDEPETAGQAEAQALMATLDIDEDALCTGAYVDMLGQQSV